MNLQYDPLLRDRMSQVGLTSWKSLQGSAGIGQKSLRYLRSGNFEKLTLAQLREAAKALDWSLPFLFEQFGLIPSPTQESSQEILSQECQRLKQQLSQQTQLAATELQAEIFQQLQSLLTNYPSVQRMSQAKPDLPAKNLVSLFTPLENLIRSWSYERIGFPWEQVPFDPQLHQPDNPEIAVGELVYVRFVGYRVGDRILCPAKVSRTLPGGIA